MQWKREMNLGENDSLKLAILLTQYRENTELSHLDDGISAFKKGSQVEEEEFFNGSDDMACS